jgi:hypothetical protein
VHDGVVERSGARGRGVEERDVLAPGDLVKLLQLVSSEHVARFERLDERVQAAGRRLNARAGHRAWSTAHFDAQVCVFALNATGATVLRVAQVVFEVVRERTSPPPPPPHK